MKILDACCGSKMFWYDKKQKDTVYMDIRNEVLEMRDRNAIRKVEIVPDIQADFRKMPFNDEVFDVVVFDPPHLIKAGDNSWLFKKYGRLHPESWQKDLSSGFNEYLRVLKPTGVLLFKWNEEQIKIKDVLEIFGKKPILGDKRSKTKWSVFIKG